MEVFWKTKDKRIRQILSTEIHQSTIMEKFNTNIGRTSRAFYTTRRPRRIQFFLKKNYFGGTKQSCDATTSIMPGQGPLQQIPVEVNLITSFKMEMGKWRQGRIPFKKLWKVFGCRPTVLENLWQYEIYKLWNRFYIRSLQYKIARTPKKCDLG